MFRAYYPNSLALVLTPRCDLAQTKADFLLLCAVAPAAEVAGKQGWREPGTVRNHFSTIIEQRQPRWHWFDPIAGVPAFQNGGVADFQLVASAALAQVDEFPTVVGLAGPWRELVNARYAAYVGRVGVPDVSKEQRDLYRQAIIEQVAQDRAVLGTEDSVADI